MSDIDFQNGFICGMATKGLVYSISPVRDNSSQALLHCEDFSDSSAFGHSVEGFGTPLITSARSKFGDSSIYFDGNSYVAIGSDTTFDPGYSDFTIEMWINLSVSITTKRGCLFGKYYYDGSREKYYFLELLNGKINAAASNQYGSFSNIYHMGTGALSWNLNQWYHIALVKGAGEIMIFRDGIRQTIVSDKYYKPYDGVTPLPQIQSRATIGDFIRTGLSRPFVGYIDEVRISDVARWTADFYPPETQYAR